MSAIIVGRFSAEQSEALALALSRAGLSVRSASDGPSARRMLKDGTGTHLMIIDAAMVELDGLMTWVRTEASLVGLLAVAIVPVASDHAFAEAHWLGCDDVVVQNDLGAITRRGAVLKNYDPSLRPAVTQGRAVIAHENDHRRRILGRTLRLAGYDVVFAANAAELAESCAKENPPALVVSAAAISSEMKDEIAIPTVVVGTEGALRELEERTKDNARVAGINEQAPPDHLLFVANELLRPGVRNLRASQRMLHDALCAFRPAGQLHAVLGLTYNLSREGLYVRTLDPPPSGAMVWFELRPPGLQEVVHLRGTVMWARSMDRGPGGAAPPGFGVRVVAEACPAADLATYREAYDRLAESGRLVA
jgi:CheY-like chemotaxis protein